MKKIVLCGILLLMLMTGMAHAALTTIGTATYNGQDYNLIWDDNNNGNSVVWLDYPNLQTDWDSQVAWAASLNGSGVLTYNIDSAYTVEWGVNSWRLPSSYNSSGPSSVFSYDGTGDAGYNFTSCEMGHLFHTELGNLGAYDTSGRPQSGYGLTKTGDFENLIEGIYWSGTPYGGYYYYAWCFALDRGYQGAGLKEAGMYGLAVRSGQVSAIPVPSTFLLLGFGLCGLAGVSRRNK